MPAFARPRLACTALVCALACGVGACNGGSKAPALSRSQDVVHAAPIPPENAPELGVIAEWVQVREFTDSAAPSLGVLHAGARVARSQEPVSHHGCADGWYAIRPRGFVCVGVEATLDMHHPTLAAMALAPHLDAPLPYTYARARRETPLYQRAPGQADAVQEVSKLHHRAAMAVVGSWRAREPSGDEARLALLSDGHFVRAADLEAARASDFQGVELNQEHELPIAFVVKRGVRKFHLDGHKAEKGDLIEYHSELPLSGRFRTLGRTKYWALGDGSEREDGAAWVRHQDVTVVRRRSVFPDFVQEQTRWIDVSVTTDTLVAYEGKHPVFATLISVARELPETGDTEPANDGPRSIPLGTFTVARKALTFVGDAKSALGEPFEVFDIPWALELSSGQLLHGAYWHDRFGIEHGGGGIELSPADAARLFHFVGPDLPPAWHAIALSPQQSATVVIRH